MLSSKHLSHKLIFHVLQYYNDNNNLTSHIYRCVDAQHEWC